MIVRNFPRILTLLAALLVGTALIWGFVIVGSPFAARRQKFDDRRVEDLRAIHDAIQRMVIENIEGKVRPKRALPASLDEVAAYVRSEQNQRELKLHDPYTGEPYTYRVKSETQYELGATFSLKRELNNNVFWNHPAGLHCFAFDAVDDAAKKLADSGPRWH